MQDQFCKQTTSVWNVGNVAMLVDLLVLTELNYADHLVK